ncbi:iron complex transport system ATP-binding protein, partial [termite gut metagenome]
MQARENTIDIKNLTIGYSSKKNKKIVAENINSSIFSGELTCLLGANGIGKSTLLRTLSAFQPPLSGNISIQNHEIGEYHEKELATLV